MFELPVIYYCSFQGGSLLPVSGVSFGDVSPYICTYYFQFCLGYIVATFWERAAHSVDHMFSLYFEHQLRISVSFASFATVFVAFTPDSVPSQERKIVSLNIRSTPLFETVCQGTKL